MRFENEHTILSLSFSLYLSVLSLAPPLDPDLLSSTTNTQAQRAWKSLIPNVTQKADGADGDQDEEERGKDKEGDLAV